MSVWGHPLPQAIAFAVFAICVLLHFPLMIALATRLDARHPRVWKPMRVWMLFFWPLIWFALARKDQGMGDPILSARARRLQIVSFVGFGAWLSFVFFGVSAGR
ncbi:MAG: hypothetical protein Q8L23_05775 [Caulobacter sp.]|nr:hypothetical protein [Caulobacter sp.]